MRRREKACEKAREKAWEKAGGKARQTARETAREKARQTAGETTSGSHQLNVILVFEAGEEVGEVGGEVEAVGAAREKRLHALRAQAMRGQQGVRGNEGATWDEVRLG